MNAWSTHQPLIKLLLKAYNPRFVMELGIGVYSTPLFLQHESERVFIENDKAWIDKMGIDAIHHKIEIPNQDIPVHSISVDQKREIFNYYYELKESLWMKPTPRFLFVDNFSCCRALAINTLAPAFDLIIYHDSEPQSTHRNNYYFGDGLKEFDHYNLQTPSTWASCFVSKKLPEVDLSRLIEPIIKEYEIESETTGIRFVKE